METTQENKNNESKLIYNNEYVSNDINKFLKVVEFEDMVIYPLVFNKSDLEYIIGTYKNPSKELNQHQYINLLFVDSILSDYGKSNQLKDGCEFEVKFNQSTINKLNGILYSYEKKVGRCVSLDEIIKKLIDNEYSRNRKEHYKSYKQVRNALGVQENG